MNIPFIGRRTTTAPQITESDRQKEQNKLLAPKTGPRGGKLPSEGQAARAQRRQRQRDSAAMARKSRRAAFRQAKTEHHLGQNVLGMARVFLAGAGTEEMQRNVEGHIDFLAERYSKREGIPYLKARAEVVDRLRAVLDARDGEAAA